MKVVDFFFGFKPFKHERQQIVISNLFLKQRILVDISFPKLDETYSAILRWIDLLQIVCHRSIFVFQNQIRFLCKDLMLESIRRLLKTPMLLIISMGHRSPMIGSKGSPESAPMWPILKSMKHRHSKLNIRPPTYLQRKSVEESFSLLLRLQVRMKENLYRWRKINPYQS